MRASIPLSRSVVLSENRPCFGNASVASVQISHSLLKFFSSKVDEYQSRCCYSWLCSDSQCSIVFNAQGYDSSGLAVSDIVENICRMVWLIKEVLNCTEERPLPQVTLNTSWYLQNKFAFSNTGTIQFTTCLEKVSSIYIWIRRAFETSCNGRQDFSHCKEGTNDRHGGFFLQKQKSSLLSMSQKRQSSAHGMYTFVVHGRCVRCVKTVTSRDFRTDYKNAEGWYTFCPG